MIEKDLDATYSRFCTFYACMKRKGDALWKKTIQIDGPHVKKENYALEELS